MLRFLGLLFLLVLAIAAFGLFRGWFTVSSVEAGGGVMVRIDPEKMKGDTAQATETLGELSRKAAERIRELAHKVSEKESALSGQIVRVDGAALRLEIEANGELLPPLDLDPQTAVLLGGRAVTLEQLAAGDRVAVTVRQEGEAVRVTRVEAER